MGKLIAAAAVAVAVGYAGFYAYQHREWARYNRLYHRSALTDGWVTGKRPPGDGRVDYAFQTDVKMYTETDTGGFGNPEAEDLEVGDRLIVYFDPADPSLSCLGSPVERARHQNVALFRVIAPAFLVAGFFLWRELRRHGPLKPS